MRDARARALCIQYGSRAHDLVEIISLCTHLTVDQLLLLRAAPTVGYLNKIPTKSTLNYDRLVTT